jgi:hypothetical protein
MEVSCFISNREEGGGRQMRIVNRTDRHERYSHQKNSRVIRKPYISPHNGLGRLITNVLYMDILVFVAADLPETEKDCLRSIPAALRSARVSAIHDELQRLPTFG